MKLGIVGNNDGPLHLLKALRDTSYQPELVGLQNRVSGDLKTRYKSEINEAQFFQGFDEQKLLEKLDPLDFDLLINCFCNFRFDELLEQSFDVLNIHLSPLPKYRGRHPLQWALINGEKEFGFTIHQMTEEYDAGEIYWQQTVAVDDGMSVAQLRSCLMDKMQAGFANFLRDYKNGKLQAKPNNDDKASYLPRRTPEDSELAEWHDSNLIYRKVQALRSEDYPAYIDAGNLMVECFGADFGEEIDHDMKRPFIYEINSDRFQIVCLDGQSVWLHCAADKLKYLNLGQNF